MFVHFFKKVKLHYQLHFFFYTAMEVFFGSTLRSVPAVERVLRRSQ